MRSIIWFVIYVVASQAMPITIVNKTESFSLEHQPAIQDFLSYNETDNNPSQFIEKIKALDIWIVETAELAPKWKVNPENVLRKLRRINANESNLEAALLFVKSLSTTIQCTDQTWDSLGRVALTIETQPVSVLTKDLLRKAATWASEMCLPKFEEKFNNFQNKLVDNKELATLQLAVSSLKIADLEPVSFTLNDNDQLGELEWNYNVTRAQLAKALIKTDIISKRDGANKTQEEPGYIEKLYTESLYEPCQYHVETLRLPMLIYKLMLRSVESKFRRQFESTQSKNQLLTFAICRRLKPWTEMRSKLEQLDETIGDLIQMRALNDWITAMDDLIPGWRPDGDSVARKLRKISKDESDLSRDLLLINNLFTTRSIGCPNTVWDALRKIAIMVESRRVPKLVGSFLRSAATQASEQCVSKFGEQFKDFQRNDILTKAWNTDNINSILRTQHGYWQSIETEFSKSEWFYDLPAEKLVGALIRASKDDPELDETLKRSAEAIRNNTDSIENLYDRNLYEPCKYQTNAMMETNHIYQFMRNAIKSSYVSVWDKIPDEFRPQVFYFSVCRRLKPFEEIKMNLLEHFIALLKQSDIRHRDLLLNEVNSRSRRASGA